MSATTWLLALLRILDRPDIQPAESAQALAQSAIQYHAVTDRLTEITSDDPEGRRLVAQAQAAMTAGHFNDTEALLRRLEDREVAFSNRSPNGAAGPASSAAQHLISAAQAGTVLGEIALMKLRYGEATGYFQAAQQRLALLSHEEPEPAGPRPGRSVGPTAADTAPAQSTDAPSTAETKPPLPQPDAGSGQAGSAPPVPQIDPDHPDAPRQQNPAAAGSSTHGGEPVGRGDNRGAPWLAGAAGRIAFRGHRHLRRHARAAAPPRRRIARLGRCIGSAPALRACRSRGRRPRRDRCRQNVRSGVSACDRRTRHPGRSGCGREPGIERRSNSATGPLPSV